MSDRFGPSSKKETVYSGPSPAMPGRTAYGVATEPKKETVYGGPPAGGTVYSGPGTAGSAYDPVKPAPVVAAAKSSGKEANVFFLIAVFTLINTVLLSNGALFATAIGLGITRVLFVQALANGSEPTPVYILSAALIAGFVGLGIFARRGVSTAFLIGLLLYGADVGILCWDGVAVHIPSIVVHVIFLVGMFKGYRLTQQ